MGQATVKLVVIVFVTVAFTAWIIKFAFDHDGETITIGGPDPSSQVAADPGNGGSGGSVRTTRDIGTGDTDPKTGLTWILEEDLPVFAQGTLVLIDQGGPFPYDRDGVTFENREGILPARPGATTTSTRCFEPGSTDRGRAADRDRRGRRVLLDRGPLRVVRADPAEIVCPQPREVSRFSLGTPKDR